MKYFLESYSCLEKCRGMEMKGIYIYFSYIDKETPSGIDKKVLAQLSVFEKAGLNCKVVVFPYIHSIYTKIVGRIPFTNVDPKWVYDDRFKEIDFLYFRRPFYKSFGLRKFLRKVKKSNPKVKVVEEIPTFPYDHELTASPMNYPLWIKDKYNRKRMQEIVDRFAVIGEGYGRLLWGVPVIPLINGIVADKIAVKRDMHEDGCIRMVCVSSFEFWHGYDRVLEGLGRYYQTKHSYKIYLYMVGDGAQRNIYNEIVKKYSIDDYVFFEGECTGEKLEQIYDMADIALECFGMYRKNMSISSSLKSREYLAKGLPVVAGCKNDIFQNNTFPYYLEMPNDDSIINIEEIVRFYNACYPDEESHRNVIMTIRKFAEENIDMNVTMKNIINYIKYE